MDRICPICENTTFKAYNGRADAVCTRCKSLERGRLQWLAIEELDLLREGMRVLHFAPEPFLLDRLAELCGDLYHPCDVDPSRYRRGGVRVFHMDICRDLSKMPSSCFDLILHNHVLEHIPCDVAEALREMVRVLVPGGTMLFSVPFRGPTTTEDLDPTLSVEERCRRFGQSDHMRLFGTEDFVPFLREVLQTPDPMFHPERTLTEEELRRAGIPKPRAPGRLDGHTIFVYRKPSPEPGTPPERDAHP